jgi:hypothetical protein
VSLTFEQFAQAFRVTPEERSALAWHLGQIRARNTYHALRLVNETRCTICEARAHQCERCACEDASLNQGAGQ